MTGLTTDSLFSYTTNKTGAFRSSDGILSATRSTRQASYKQQADEESARAQDQQQQRQRNSDQFNTSLKTFITPHVMEPGSAPVLSSDAVVMLQQASDATESRWEHPSAQKKNNASSILTQTTRTNTAEETAEEGQTTEVAEEETRFEPTFFPVASSLSSEGIAFGSNTNQSQTFLASDNEALPARLRHAAQLYAATLSGYQSVHANAETVLVA